MGGSLFVQNMSVQLSSHLITPVACTLYTIFHRIRNDIIHHNTLYTIFHRIRNDIIHHNMEVLSFNSTRNDNLQKNQVICHNSHLKLAVGIL